MFKEEKMVHEYLKKKLSRSKVIVGTATDSHLIDITIVAPKAEQDGLLNEVRKLFGENVCFYSFWLCDMGLLECRLRKHISKRRHLS